MSYIGDHVWFMTSRQTLPDLEQLSERVLGLVMDSQLVNVGVEYAVGKAYARTLVGVLIRQLDMYLPATSSEWRLFRSLEADVELLHVVVDQCDLIIAHEQLHHVPAGVRGGVGVGVGGGHSRLDTPLW